MSASPGRGDSSLAATLQHGPDDFQRDLQRRKRERWAKILAAEPPGRTPERRPRDPEQERMLAAARPAPAGAARRAQAVGEKTRLPFARLGISC